MEELSEIIGFFNQWDSCLESRIEAHQSIHIAYNVLDTMFG